MKLFDVNHFNGMVEHVAKQGDKTIIKRSQDVSKILSENQAELNNSSSNWKGDFHKVASIPFIVVEQWRNELKAKGASDINPLSRENKKFLISKLNDYNYSRLRTKDGVI